MVRAHYRPFPHRLEDLPLRELLEILLGPEGRRRLRLRHMTNEEGFKQYDSELMLRLHNTKDLSDHRRMLDKFKEYIGGFPPTAELAKGFLSQYIDRSPRTQARYNKMISGLMKWYGELFFFLSSLGGR